MSSHHLPPDLSGGFYSIATTALAGIFGAFVRQLINRDKTWLQRVFEGVGGGFFAVYASPAMAEILYHILLKYDFITEDGMQASNIIGLSGFICGAVGISFIEFLVISLRKKFGISQ